MFAIAIVGLIVGVVAYAAYNTATKIPEYSIDIPVEKNNLTTKDETIIGIREPVLIQNPESALTVEKFDTTEYPDRAVLQLKNNDGTDAVINGISIRGKLVVKSAGQNGYVWEYSDYDAIDKEGERFFEISNDYMTSPEHVEAVGDFCWKTLKPHNVYQLQLAGAQHQYQIGDFYQLTVEYQLPSEPSQIELIDVPVEIMNVSVAQNVGEIGQTMLTVRQAIGTWNKTTSRRARLIGAGLPQFLLNRGNEVLVASSTWTGQADYYCSGADDHVIIQEAIDNLANAGGGIVRLTGGIFYPSSTILFKDNIALIGRGFGTIIKSSATNRVFSLGNILTPRHNIGISDMCIDASLFTGSLGAISGNFAGDNAVISNISFKNSNSISYGIIIGGITFSPKRVIITNCIFDNWWGEAIVLDGNDCVLSNITITDNRQSTGQPSIIRIQGNGNIVTDCKLTGVQSNINADTNGIYVFGDSCNVSSCNIENVTNIFAGRNGTGFKISGNNNTVSGVFVSACDNGVLILSGATKNILVSIRSTNNGTTNYNDAGTSTTISGTDFT